VFELVSLVVVCVDEVNFQRDGQTEEDIVTSSCEEPYNRSFATQTLKSPEQQRASTASTSHSKELNRAIKEALEAVRQLTLFALPHELQKYILSLPLNSIFSY